MNIEIHVNFPRRISTHDMVYTAELLSNLASGLGVSHIQRYTPGEDNSSMEKFTSTSIDKGEFRTPGFYSNSCLIDIGMARTVVVRKSQAVLIRRAVDLLTTRHRVLFNYARGLCDARLEISIPYITVTFNGLFGYDQISKIPSYGKVVDLIYVKPLKLLVFYFDFGLKYLRVQAEMYDKSSDSWIVYTSSIPEYHSPLTDEQHCIAREFDKVVLRSLYHKPFSISCIQKVGRALKRKSYSQDLAKLGITGTGDLND